MSVVQPCIVNYQPVHSARNVVLKRFFDLLQVAFQLPLPQHLLTRCFGWLADRRSHWFKTLLIRTFTQIYNVDMTEAAVQDINEFNSFNHFFTRALKPHVRPMPTVPVDWISPCDGKLSARGLINNNRLIQAKSIDYPLHHLLGCSPEKCSGFMHGSFATIYLSPRDYHRIHMPRTGRLTEYHYIPGRLYSVSPATTRALPDLFCRNERVVCWFKDSYDKPFVVVLVGAMIVGGIITRWHGRFRHDGISDTLIAPGTTVLLEQGEELGQFLLGSTVILISNGTALDTATDSGVPVRLHQPL